MNKIQYPFEVLIKKYEWLRQVASNRLSEIKSTIDRNREEFTEIKKHCAEVMDEFNQPNESGFLDMHRLHRSEGYFVKQKATIQSKQFEITTSEKNKEIAHRELKCLHAKVKLLKKHKEKLLEEHQKDLSRKEQNQIEEIVCHLK